jgi:hypothetical protein
MMCQKLHSAQSVDEVFIALADLDKVSHIEERAYTFPWTPGNFRDS